MFEKQKYFNWLRKRPSGLAIALISSLFFSIFLSFAYPLSVAYTQSHQLFLPFAAKPDEITLAWNSNSEPDLAGYKIYIGKSSRKYTQVMDLGLTTRYTYSFLMDGTPYYFALSAYNQQRIESGFSSEIRYP